MVFDMSIGEIGAKVRGYPSALEKSPCPLGYPLSAVSVRGQRAGRMIGPRTWYAATIRRRAVEGASP